MTALVIVTLSFISLTTINFPTQNAQAATGPLCGLIDSTGGTPPVTATTVTYGNKKFDIIGYNKNGNEVGVAGPNNSVTLLLNKTEPFNNGYWTSPENDSNVYQGSYLLDSMQDFVSNILLSNDGIISRTLTGGSGYFGAGDYNGDYVAGPNVTGQKAWPLSVDETLHLILSTRLYNDWYWLRSPADDSKSAAIVYANGETVSLNAYNVAEELAYRPALYLDINSPVFNGLVFDGRLQIGACQAEYTDLRIDYDAETITGLDTDVQGWSFADNFAGLSTPVQLSSTTLDISSNISTTSSTLYYVKAATDTNIYFNSNTNSNGVAQESKSKLIIPARPSAPSGLSGIAPSSLGGGDGKITGTSNKMEYSTDEATWTSVTGAAITGLTSGTYFVRTIADQSTSKFKSFATEVIVKEGSVEPSAGKPGSGSGLSAGDGGFSSEGTAQTGIDFVRLGLVVLLMLVGTVVLRRSVTGIMHPEIAASPVAPRNDG
jgi:hypothetical protein